MSFLKLSLFYSKSCQFAKGNGGDYMLAEIISTIYGEMLTDRPKAPWMRQKDQKRDNKLAWIFFAKDKESFHKGVSCRTYATLSQYIRECTVDPERYIAPFITFNGFASKTGGKSIRNLRWLNAVSIELDDPEATAADVIHLCDMFDLPYPTMIIKSPNGLHVHWHIVREPAFRQNIESFQVIGDALKKTFRTLGADATGPERYWRMPMPWNTLYETDELYTLNELVAWARDLLDLPVAVSFRAKQTNKRPVVKGILNNPAIQELMNGVPTGLRNNTCYTLGLILASSSDMSDQEIIEFMVNTWNPRNEKRLGVRELKRAAWSAIRDVRSGRRKGASAKWINRLLEQMGSQKRFVYQIRTKYVSRNIYTKRSALIEKILGYVSSQGGSVKITQRGLAEELNECFKSVQLALKQLEEEGSIHTSTKRGPNGGTVITLPSTEKVVEVGLATEEPVIIPMPSEDPVRHVLNLIAAGTERTTLAHIHSLSGLDHALFMQTIMNLIGQGRVLMLEPSRDGTARFILGPPN